MIGRVHGDKLIRCSETLGLKELQEDRGCVGRSSEGNKSASYLAGSILRERIVLVALMPSSR